MSIIAANGRHEDDLLAEADRNDNRMVRVANLLDHLEGVLGDPASGYGAAVALPARAAADTIRLLMTELKLPMTDGVQLPAVPGRVMGGRP